MVAGAIAFLIGVMAMAKGESEGLYLLSGGITLLLKGLSILEAPKLLKNGAP